MTSQRASGPRTRLAPIYEEIPVGGLSFSDHPITTRLIDDHADLDARISCSRKRVLFLITTLACASIGATVILGSQYVNYFASGTTPNNQKVIEECLKVIGIVAIGFAALSFWKSCRYSEEVRPESGLNEVII